MKKYIRSATGDLSLQLFSDAREILDYFEWHNRNLNKRQEEILSDLSDAVDSGSTIAVRESIGNLKFNSKNFTNEQYYIVTDLYNELCTSGGKYESIGRYNDIESSTSIVTASMADEIYELSNVNTFWDDVRSLVGDGYYEDYQIKDIQRIADRRYDELVNGYEQKKWSVSIWGYVFIVEADSKDEAIDIAIKEYNDNPPDGIKVDPVEDAHQIGAKPVR